MRPKESVIKLPLPANQNIKAVCDTTDILDCAVYVLDRLEESDDEVIVLYITYLQSGIQDLLSIIEKRRK